MEPHFQVIYTSLWHSDKKQRQGFQRAYIIFAFKNFSCTFRSLNNFNTWICSTLLLCSLKQISLLKLKLALCLFLRLLTFSNLLHSYFEFYNKYVCFSWTPNLISKLSQIQSVSNPHASIKMHTKQWQSFSYSGTRRGIQLEQKIKSSWLMKRDR
jgi:hypothetical protein